MCDSAKHTHTKIEEWITPINSRFLSSKMVHLFPGDHVHEHSTGPGREEVLIILYGSVTVTLEKSSRIYSSGETCFIPEDTLHAVSNDGDAPAQYAYICTKKRAVNGGYILGQLSEPEWRKMTGAL